MKLKTIPCRNSFFVGFHFPNQEKRFAREHFTFARQEKRFPRKHFAFARQEKRFPRCRPTDVVFRRSVHPPAEPQPGQARRSAGRLTPTMNATSILLASGPPKAPNTRSNFLQTPVLSTLALNPLRSRRHVRLQSTPRHPVANSLHKTDGMTWKLLCAKRRMYRQKIYPHGFTDASGNAVHSQFGRGG